MSIADEGERGRKHCRTHVAGSYFSNPTFRGKKKKLKNIYRLKRKKWRSSTIKDGEREDDFVGRFVVENEEAKSGDEAAEKRRH